MLRWAVKVPWNDPRLAFDGVGVVGALEDVAHDALKVSPVTSVCA
jgi:hypothetical protein